MKMFKKIFVTMLIGVLFGCCASVGVLASESDAIVKKYEKPETLPGQTIQEYAPNQLIVAVSATATTKEVEDEILSYAEEYRIHGQYNGKYLQKVDMDVIRTKDEPDFTMCITIKEGLDLDDTIAALKEKSMVVWCHKNYYAEYAEQGDVPTPSIAENVTTETVQPVVVKKITYVNVKKITLKAGKKFTVKVKATGKVKFTSSNKKIVKVTQKGVVKAKKKGSAKIIITCGKTSKTIKVKVK